MAGSKIGTIIALDGEKEFRSAVKGVNTELTGLKAQLGHTKEAFAGQANSLEALKSKHEVLTKILEAQKKKEEEVSKGLENAKKNYENVGTGLEKLKKSYDEAQKKMEEMSKSSDTTEDELKKQESTVTELGEAIEKGGKNYETAGNRVKNWETQLVTAETQTSKANRAVDENAKYMGEAEKATDKCATSIDEYGKKTKNAADGTKEVSEGINALAGAVVASGIKKGVDEVADALLECAEAAGQFETGIAKVMTIADETAVNMGQMKNSVLELSSATGKGVGDIAEATYQAISASVDTAKAVGFVKDASKLAVGGFTDESTAVDVLTTALNAYKLEADETTRISDVLITTQNLGKTSVAALGSNMGKVIPVAAAFKMNIENLATGYAILTKNGIKTEDSTTQMKAALSELGKSSSQVATILKEETGKTFAELMEDGLSLGDVIQILGEHVDGNAIAFKNLWSTSTAGVGMLSLFNAGAEEFTTTLAAMEASTGATDTAFEKMTQTAEFAQQKMENSINNLKIAIGDQLQPALNDLRETGTNVFDWATGFVKDHPWIVSALTGVTVALGALATAVAGLMIAKSAAKAMHALNITMLSNPFVLAATAIIGVGTALVTLVKNADVAKSESAKLAEETRNLAKEAKALKASVGESKAAFDESKTSTVAQYGAYKSMSDELYRLNDSLKNETMSEEKAVVTKAKMKTIVGQLKSEMPDLNLTIDEQSGLLKEAKKDVDNYIESMQKKAMMSVVEEHMTEILQKQEEARWKATEAEIKGEQAVKQSQDSYDKAVDSANAYADMLKLQEEFNFGAADANKEFENALNAIAAQYNVTRDEMENGIDALERWENENVECLNAVSDSNKAQEIANKTIEETSEEYDLAVETLMEYGKALNMSEDEIMAFIGSTSGAADATDEYTGALEENAEAMKNSVDAAEIQREALDSVRDRYNEVMSEIKNDLQNKFNIFEKFNGGTDISVEQMLANMKSQTEGLENYKENLATLSKEVGNTIAPEFMQYLRDMGTDGANMMQHMVDTMQQGNYPELFREISQEYMKSLELSDDIAEAGAKIKVAYEMAMGELGSTEADFSGLRESIDKAVDDAGEGWAELSDTTKAELETALETAQEVGIKIPEGLAESIAKGETSATDAITSLNSSIEGTFDGLAKIAKDSGIDVPAELTEGIKKGGPDAQEAISRLVQLISDAEGDISNTDMSGAVENSFDGILDVVKNSTADIPDATREAFEGAVEAARESGAEIPEGLAEGIASGKVSVEEATQQLNDLLKDGNDEAEEAGREKGEAHSKAQADGMKKNQKEVEKAADTVTKAASNIVKKYTGSYQNNGRDLINAMAQGMRNSSPNVSSAAGSAASSGANAGNSYYGSYSSMGSNLIDGIAVGMQNNSGKLADIARQAVRNALNAAKAEGGVKSPARVWRDELGKMLSEGVAVGIEDGEKDVVKSTVNMAKASILAAKDELEIASPSKIFKKFGEYVSEGLSIGIIKKGKIARQSSAKVSKQVYEEAAKWFKEYKSLNKVTLEDEKKFWNNVVAVTKKGSKDHKKAKTKVEDIKKWQKKVQAANKDHFGVTRKDQKGNLKNDKTFYSEKFKNANTWIENRKGFGNKSLQQEKYFWEQVQKGLKKGTQAYADAAKKIKALNTKIIKEREKAQKEKEKADKAAAKAAEQAAKEKAEAEKQEKKEKADYGVSGSALQNYKTYYKVSAKAEVDYWNTVRNASGLTREQQIEADRNYFEALENFNEEKKRLDDEYADNVARVNEKMREDIDTLTKEYEDAVKDRKQAIYDSFGLFDAFYSESEDGEVLLENMKSQVEGYAFWIDQLDVLKEKGISDNLYEQLQAQGPAAAATIKALNDLSEEQIQELNALNEQKLAMAESQAVAENEELRKQNEHKIKIIQDQAKSEINEYKVAYEKGFAELTAVMTPNLKKLADQATTLGEDAANGLILGFTKAGTDKSTKQNLEKVTASMEKGLSGLPKAGKTLGKDMLSGILNALQNEKKIKSSGKSFVKALEDSIKTAAEIKSPSKRFKKNIGLYLPAGVTEGIKEGSKDTAKAGEEMINDLVSKSQSQLEKQKLTLSAYAEDINAGAGIAKLNELTATPLQQETSVTVNNTGILSAMENMVSIIQNMGEEIKNLKVVMDTGELVGVVGNELTAEARRW